MAERTADPGEGVGFEASGRADASVAASRGSATHKLLEHLDFSSAASAEQLDRESVGTKSVTQDDSVRIDDKGIDQILMVFDRLSEQTMEREPIVQQNRIDAACRQIAGNGASTKVEFF